MSAMALPISELGPVVVKAKAETKRVVCYSKAETSKLTFGVAWDTFAGVWHLRKQFSVLVEMQASLIRRLVVTDFTRFPMEELKSLATEIDDLLTDERYILAEANKLGSELRYWWTKSLLEMEQQVEHLDSIAESLHVECDPEASLLLAMAVEQLSAQNVQELAIQ
jgi:hypothetical protein